MTSVVCDAWEKRGKSPIFKIVGGVNAMIAAVEMVPLDTWVKATGSTLANSPMDYAARFAQADFLRDVHYFAIIQANHPGTITWPVCTPRFRFPLPASEMDAYVEAARRRLAEEKRQQIRKQVEGHNPWVKLVGLNTEAALNGQCGIRGAWHENRGRWAVQLESGREVKVKPANLEYQQSRE